MTDLQPPIREFQDRGVIWLLESREFLRALLELVARDISSQLDFSQAERLNRSMVPPDLHKQEADVLYRLPYADSAEDVLVYVLVEHQSRDDSWMPLRLLRYMVALWEAQCRAWDDDKVPLSQRRLTTVIPVVFYTGKTPWQLDRGLAPLFAAPPSLGGFIPRYDVLFLALRDMPDEALTGSTLAYVLQVLKAESAPLNELERIIERVVGALDELSDDQAAEWKRAMWFVWLLVVHRRSREEQSRLLTVVSEAAGRHRKEVTEMSMTGWEAAVEKGREKGREQGQAEGGATILLQFLEARFGTVPDHLREAVKAQSMEAQSALVRRVASAQSLREIEESLKG